MTKSCVKGFIVTNVLIFFRALVLDPAAQLYYRWLAIISLAILYNVIIIIGRSVFWELQNLCPRMWYFMDYLCDILYITDIAVHCRTGYLEQGLLVRDRNKLIKNYTSSVAFKLDILSIFPTDLFYVIIGTSCECKVPCSVIVRLNRLFRFPRMSEFFDRRRQELTSHMHSG
ncbi:cyclic nucleotide-gated cation channel subunit A [Caerostris darwini]|uniref:Cyclic nucleotide-gated cation channel subunit A n=1 Tax=Caerostris darwini TaxID=1538125 RepID=A0AAV4ULZ1_9ARAC|nr:cyclic nucleotide-gated cation channel subunit A [Caerostris darwini]